MIVTPIKTRILQPPQDDLLAAISESELELQEEDIVIVSSKVVAIHEGRCIPITDDIDKDELAKKESDVFVERPDSRWKISIVHSAFISSAGVDESNGNGHYVLLPKDPQKSAEELYNFFREKYGVKKLGVVIVDSHSIPLRYGALGISLGWWGIEPITYFTGKPDLFDRPVKYLRTNIADSLAAAGVLAIGEVDEQTPVAVVQGVPHVTFTNRDTSKDLFVPPREDKHWSFLKGFYEEE